MATTAHCPECDSTDIRERNIAVASLPVTAWVVEDGELNPAAYDSDVDTEWSFDDETDKPYVCYDCMWDGTLEQLQVREDEPTAS